MLLKENLGCYHIAERLEGSNVAAPGIFKWGGGKEGVTIYDAPDLALRGKREMLGHLPTVETSGISNL